MSRKNPAPDAVAAGARLGTAIDNSGMVRARFAASAKIGPDTLSRMIAGKAPRALDSSTFRKVACAILGITQDQLDGDEPLPGEENPESTSTRSSDVA